MAWFDQIIVIEGPPIAKGLSSVFAYVEFLDWMS